jgi:hypothetical protein
VLNESIYQLPAAYKTSLVAFEIGSDLYLKSPIFEETNTNGPIHFLQYAVKRFGRVPILVDGKFGPDTDIGLRKFQTLYGLTSNGHNNEATQVLIDKLLRTYGDGWMTTNLPYTQAMSIFGCPCNSTSYAGFSISAATDKLSYYAGYTDPAEAACSCYQHTKVYSTCNPYGTTVGAACTGGVCYIDNACPANNVVVGTHTLGCTAYVPCTSCNTDRTHTVLCGTCNLLANQVCQTCNTDRVALVPCSRCNTTLDRSCLTCNTDRSEYIPCTSCNTTVYHTCRQCDVSSYSEERSEDYS